MSSSSPLPQTRIREALSPYLPPPVVRGIQWLDPQLRPYMGPEGTVTLMSTVLFAWAVLLVTRRIARPLLALSEGRAIASEHDNDTVAGLLKDASASNESFDATVLLTGPPDGGKTRLFYHLCHGESDLPTLMSIKANLSISSSSAADGKQGIRYMDWPGYAGLDDGALHSLLNHPQAATNLRMVLVLDSTQPVSAAADSLYHILEHYAAVYNKNNNKKRKQQTVPTVFVACHKKDLAKAKTFKRVKIQLRTELERLLRVKSASNTSNNNEESAASSPASWWPDASKELNLDELPFCKLHFASTTCVVANSGDKKAIPGNEELLEFCRTGKVPVATATNNE